jgi:hypothetical protein
MRLTTQNVTCGAFSSQFRNDPYVPAQPAVSGRRAVRLAGQQDVGPDFGELLHAARGPGLPSTAIPKAAQAADATPTRGITDAASTRI